METLKERVRTAVQNHRAECDKSGSKVSETYYHLKVIGINTPINIMGCELSKMVLHLDWDVSVALVDKTHLIAKYPSSADQIRKYPFIRVVTITQKI